MRCFASVIPLPTFSNVFVTVHIPVPLSDLFSVSVVVRLMNSPSSSASFLVMPACLDSTALQSVSHRSCFLVVQAPES